MKTIRPELKEITPESVSAENQREPNPIKILRTDFGNAELFAKLYGNDIRYCYESRKWLVWDGKRWCEDNTGEIYRKGKLCIKRILRSALNTGDDELIKHSIKSQNAYRLRAMVELTQSEPGLQVAQSALDPDPWLLNVQNGTLDLRTAEFSEHKREDFITKIMPTKYDPQASCPAWNAFLEQVMPDNQAQIKFLQKAIGYSLTGITKEQVLFIFYGTGANGKSTFVNVIHSLLGDYAMNTPTETLLVKRAGGIPNDVARLRGARFVSANEAEHGKYLAEALVKQLTGGDKITARFLYGEYFDFDMTCKLFLIVNHKPNIKGTDHAIWRRIHLIPFIVTIPQEKRDPGLTEKLKSELPGILNWALEGCKIWLQEGLEPPETVKSATKDYRVEMDLIGEFVAECCIEDMNAKTPFGALYERYKTWCAERNVDSLNPFSFATCLDERGFQPGKNKALGRFRYGIRLRDGLVLNGSGLVLNGSGLVLNG
jgi:putative DNA primase/helicase